MDFAEVVRRRRMVRWYAAREVPPAALERVLDAAAHAPSAGFSQGVQLIVVTDRRLRRAIAMLAGEPAHRAKGRPPWVSSAPVHIVVTADPGRYERRYAEADKRESVRPHDRAVPYWWVDGGATFMLLLLAAVDEGLDAGFLDVADRGSLRGLLGIPAAVEVLGLVTLGYRHPLERPVGSAVQRSRRATVRWQRWGTEC